MTRLSTLTKPLGAVAGIASGVAALVVATLFVAAPTHPDPIDPVGTWDVAAFAFTPTNNSVANNASIDGGEMTIEREAGCRSDPCNLVITTGPDLVAGVVLRPQNGRSRYVGDEVLANPSCDGADAPVELTRGRFVAEAGSGSGTLRVRDRVRAHPSLARLRSLRLPVRGDRGAPRDLRGHRRPRR